MHRIPLAGSIRAAVAALSPTAFEGDLGISLRLQPAQALDEGWLEAQALLPPAARSPLSRAAFAERHSAREEDLDAVADFAGAHGLRVARIDPLHRRVQLEGPAMALAEAFGTAWGRSGSGHRVPLRELSLPAGLAERVAGVLGLDARPRLRPHLHAPALDPDTGVEEISGPGFSPLDLATLYGFPAGTGKGQCIAVIELGGGYDPKDLDTYFAALGLPRPQVVEIAVDGATNNLQGVRDECLEVVLDLEVLGALVPEATLLLCFAPNNDEGLLDALQAVVQHELKPSIVSISWGGAEATWSPLESLLISDEVKSAAAMGVTVLASSGDDGSSDGESDGKAHVSFPASSPWVLAVGGTTLHAEGGSVQREHAWNSAPAPGATGGGISEVFGLPDYQKDAGVPPSANGEDAEAGRGVPDVAAVADRATGYRVFAQGRWMTLGGTSASTPLWAGLLARCEAQLGAPCGFLNPYLYSKAKAALRPITEGDNGAYKAGPGYNACTGLGVPMGEELLEALRGS